MRRTHRYATRVRLDLTPDARARLASEGIEVYREYGAQEAVLELSTRDGLEAMHRVRHALRSSAHDLFIFPPVPC